MSITTGTHAAAPGGPTADDVLSGAGAAPLFG